jgi:hypothetical protein
MAADKIGKISMLSDFNENLYLGFSSLPTNYSLQNTPKYQFSLKSETINNLPILLAAILETVASQR